MSDLNIEDFHKDVGEIFVRLYQSFPRKNTLYVEDIAGPADYDEYGLASKRFLSCFSTMIWLSECGYLYYETSIRQEAIDQVVLSHKGFIVLNSLNTLNTEVQDDPNQLSPSMRDGSQRNINQLRQALKSKDSQALRNCVFTLLNHRVKQA